MNPRRVCYDCAHFIAFGEHGAFTDEAVCETVARNVATLRYPSISSFHDGEFSWRPCWCCGSTLAGDRFDVMTED